jgi:plasmid stabilization system protein ParE
VTYRVGLTPDARDEYDEAIDWFDAHGRKADDFAAAVEWQLDRLRANPFIYQLVFRNARRAVVRGFPYVLFYRVRGRQVEVFSVFHAKQDPAIWQSRV